MEALNQCMRAGINDIRVVLNYGPLGLVQAVTQRIGRNHIELNTGTIALNHNAWVEIVMSIPSEEKFEHHRINARVSRCHEDGTATLRFHDCCHETLQALLPYVTRH